MPEVRSLELDNWQTVARLHFTIAWLTCCPLNWPRTNLSNG